MHELRIAVVAIGVASLLLAAWKRVRSAKPSDHPELDVKQEIAAAKYAAIGLGLGLFGLIVTGIAVVAAWFDALTVGLVFIAVGAALRIAALGAEGFLQGWREGQGRRRDGRR